MLQATDEIVSLQLRPHSLQSRVQRKREILQLWLNDGVPHDKFLSLPRSLTEARKWEDPELGIYAIGSPNNFTTRHREVGRDVQAIGALLTKLRDKVKLPPSKARAVPRKPGISVKEIHQAMSALISQWHIAREEARKQRTRADVAEKHRDIARKELRDMEVELARLRRQVFGGLSVVE
jgi:hypothetical protein